MSYLGRKGANFPLTSGDIPTGSVEGSDIAFLENTAGQNLSGTYATNRTYLSGRDSGDDYNYQITGDINIDDHLILGIISGKVDDIILMNDTTIRTISCSAGEGGTLEGGSLLSLSYDVSQWIYEE